MMVISCDPGLTGAIALICSKRGLLECEDIPICSNGQATGSMKNWVDVTGLRDLLVAWSVKHCFAENSVEVCIERPIAMPTLPSQTIACQFDTFGVIRALVSGKVPSVAVYFVNPQAWKKHFGLRSDKDESIACALKLYPSAFNMLARKKDHNRAEAILIGHWLIGELA